MFFCFRFFFSFLVFRSKGLYEKIIAFGIQMVGSMSSDSLSNVFAEIETFNRAMDTLNVELRTVLRNSKTLSSDTRQ